MRLLDLFCGAGGAARGYQEAGFYVVGVDIKPQPRYAGDEFHLGDAMELRPSFLRTFDAIHASPPCQAFTKAQRLQGNEHPDLVAPIRERLLASTRPFVIENVPGAPLINPTLLCGAMFDLRVYRHRLFETSFPMDLLLHSHSWKQTKMGRTPTEGDVIQVVGNFSGVEYGRRAMGIDWMTQKELAQAIPPQYTRYIGEHLMRQVTQ